MGYKNIRLFSLAIGLAGATLIVVAGLETFGLLGRSAASGMDQSALLVGVAFMFVSQLGRSVGSILEAQADQIADLRQQLSEGRPAS
jgi:hypothetical protein